VAKIHVLGVSEFYRSTIIGSSKNNSKNKKCKNKIEDKNTRIE
jgi:hypothetical protein